MSEAIRVGIVGLGRAGWGMHVPELRSKSEKFQLVAACDIIPERRERVAKACGCKTYATIEELLSDPEVELVNIATRSCDHFAHAKLALAAGKHVFQEKPMCATYQEAAQLAELSKVSKGKLFVRHNRRMDPDFMAIREIIDSNILGEVYSIKLARHGYQRRDDWQTIIKYGGGQLLNWGPHIVDHALRLLGAPVASQWSDLKKVAAVGDAEDHLKIVLTGTNGRVVDLEISGGVALGSPIYSVYGTRGSLTCDGSDIRLKYLDPSVPLAPREANHGTPGDTFGTPEKLAWVEETKPAVPSKQINIWDELFCAIRHGSTYPISLEEAVGVMEVISNAKKGTQFEYRR